MNSEVNQESASRFMAESGRRSISDLLHPLHQNGGINSQILSQGGIELFRFSFRGPNSSDPIRIAIFAAIHGDEPAGALAAVQFLLELATEPSLAENYLIHAYPVCNPTGFEDNTRCSRRGIDLNREFWKGSSEPEVQLIERELDTQHFLGLIQLHADDTSEGLYGFVRGATLTEHLLRPALLEAEKILPRNLNPSIDGFAARDAIIYDHYEGVLAAPARMDPVPFEIILETPQLAPVESQVEALVIAMRTVLAEYRRFISFAQNL